MAYADGVVYVPVVNAGFEFSATKFTLGDLSKATGELNAIDAASGRILWKTDLAAPDFGGATVVGDLVFTSTFSGEVLAFDRATGRQVWKWQAPGGINGFLSVAGDTVLVPMGLGNAPGLIALRIGATGQPAAQPTAAANPPVAVAPAGSQLTVSTSASNSLAFDPTTLTAAAGSQVTVQYTNDSTLPHNWHVFNGADATAPSIAQTPVKTGPGDVASVTFAAPSQPGSYFYVCDVHPTIMTGHLVVN
jgi:plastocyanin